MTKNRFGILFVLVMVIAIAFSSVNADSIIDTKTTNDVYKASEDTSEFKLPFVRVAQGRMEIDKEISQDGIFVSQSGIEVTKAVDGIQVFYSGDTVRLNADSEYSAIITNGNVIISGIVNKTTAIYCSDTVTIDEGANIKGNLLVYAPTLNINTKVDGNVLGVVSTVNINNEVGGQVRLKADAVNLGENGKVDGEFYISTTNSELNVEGATIDVVQTSKVNGVKNFFVTLLNTSLLDIVVYVLILLFVKKDRLASLTKRLDSGKRVLLNGVWSFAIIAMSVFVGIALIILLPKVGVSSIIFGLAAIIIFALLKNIVVVTFVTEMVMDKYEGRETKPNRIITAIMSIIVLNLLLKIPFVGGVLSAFLFIFALGIFVSLFSNGNKKDESKTEVVDAK